ncbi:MAG: hypothetical protein IPQ07_34430 [Myxococcales bacterium]|nr:hypothetical protein [Myxococcales bacterium]
MTAALPLATFDENPSVDRWCPCNVRSVPPAAGGGGGDREVAAIDAARSATASPRTPR